MSYLLALIVGLLVLGLLGSGYSQPRRYDRNENEYDNDVHCDTHCDHDGDDR